MEGTFPAGQFTSAIGALIERKEFPQVNWFARTSKPIDANLLGEFGDFLVDTLLEDFRKRCRTIETQKQAELHRMKKLFDALSGEFEIAIVTLNYDDIIYRMVAHAETGFDHFSSIFQEEKILQRTSWPCFLHLHGSVHFDMREHNANLHKIDWQDNLNASFAQNAGGRSRQQSVEGADFPTSVLVAGYGKTAQILRRPFRTLYAELIT